jgi:hypothetical protein
MQTQGKPQARRRPYMSIFPTKIVLATDGSREAELAARTAADLANKTDSELHVLHVLALPLDTHDPSSFEPEVWARLENRARTTLEDVVGKIEASGGEVEGSHLTAGRPEAEIVTLAEEDRSGSDRHGQLGGRQDKEGAYGQRIGLGPPARSLPRVGSARVRSLTRTLPTVPTHRPLFTEVPRS